MASHKRGLSLAQVLLEVKDVKRSKDFYTKKLGFKLQHDFSPHYLSVLTPNKLAIGFHPSKPGRSQSRKGESPVGIEFDVDSTDVWYQRLRKRGVRFVQKPKDEWGEREARFTDPDGYRLAISSPSPK